MHILNRGLRRIGIIGLVDEATGYQRIREERALVTILEKFIDKELQPWTRTFPYEFYEQIYRLKAGPVQTAISGLRLSAGTPMISFTRELLPAFWTN